MSDPNKSAIQTPSATPHRAACKAMLFAAGLGTRFKPWTDRHPKALALVNGKSLLQRNIEYLQQYGITEVIVNVHHFADQLINAIELNKGWGSAITISNETGQVLETGGGLKKAGWYFDKGDPFVVMNVDILTDLHLGHMIADHYQHRPLATLAVTGRTTSRYFLFDGQDELCGWRNVKTGDEIISRPKQPLFPKAFSGIHVIEPRIFPLLTWEGKFPIVETYLQLARTEILKSFDHSNSKLIDVGKPESVAQAEALFP